MSLISNGRVGYSSGTIHSSRLGLVHAHFSGMSALRQEIELLYTTHTIDFTQHLWQDVYIITSRMLYPQ